jgi:hypothetical protein
MIEAIWNTSNQGGNEMKMRRASAVALFGAMLIFMGLGGPALAAELSVAETQKVMDRLVATVPEISEMAKKNPANKLIMQLESAPAPGSADRIDRDYYRVYVGFYVQDGGPGHRSRWATFLLHKNRDEILWVNYLNGNSYVPLADWRQYINKKEDTKKNDWTCLPFFRVGPIQTYSSAEDIAKMFGALNVERRMIYGAEGTEKFDVTVVFPNTTNELLVFWEKNQYGQRPSAVSIRKEGSAWKTVYGIRIGTSLAELNQMNEATFSFFGFAWDYGGTVERGWGGGKLAAIDGLHVVLQETRELSRAYYGDKSLRSDDVGLLPDAARVSRIQIQLN